MAITPISIPMAKYRFTILLFGTSLSTARIRSTLNSQRDETLDNSTCLRGQVSQVLADCLRPPLNDVQKTTDGSEFSRGENYEWLV